jgi:hypothetical protein
MLQSLRAKYVLNPGIVKPLGRPGMSLSIASFKIGPAASYDSMSYLLYCCFFHLRWQAIINESSRRGFNRFCAFSLFELPEALGPRCILNV